MVWEWRREKMKVKMKMRAGQMGIWAGVGPTAGMGLRKTTIDE